MNLSKIKIGRIVLVSVITLSATALLPHNLQADGAPGFARLPQDARSRLDSARTSINSIQTYLRALQPGNFGGYIEQATNDTNHALADINAATDYISAHPDANRLQPVSQSATDPTLSLLAVSGGSGSPLYGSEQYLNTANNLINTAIRNLQNTQAGRSGAQPTYLGDLDGNRVKIMASLTKVNQDLVSAFNYSKNPLEIPSAAGAAALGKYQGKISVELADNDGPTVIEIPKVLLEGAALAGTPAAPLTAAAVGSSTPDAPGGQPYIASNDASAAPGDLSSSNDLPLHTLLPSIIASVALSGAFILGGLYFFSRRTRLRVSVPATVSLVVGAFVLGLCVMHEGSLLPGITSASAQVPPPPPPPPYTAPIAPANTRGAVAPRTRGVVAVPATPAPHFSGDAVVYIVTTGDSIHIILSRKNAADLLGQSPAR